MKILKSHFLFYSLLFLVLRLEAQENRSTELAIYTCPQSIICNSPSILTLDWSTVYPSGYMGNNLDPIPVVCYFFQGSGLNFNLNGTYLNNQSISTGEQVWIPINSSSYCTPPFALQDPMTMIVLNKICTYNYDLSRNKWNLTEEGSPLFEDIPGTPGCTQTNSVCLSAFLRAYSLRMQYAENCKKWAGNCDPTSTIYLPNERGLFAIGTDNASDGAYITEGILADRVKVMPFGNNPTCWPDYVFEPGYDLMSLGDVKAHIDTKGHLPGFPSGEEVDAAGGFELNQITLLQQEKIEELMLHLIELKKEINKRNETKTIKP